MKKTGLLLVLVGLLNGYAQAQRVAAYYFDNNLREATAAFPALDTVVKHGSFLSEIAPKLGSQKRSVYVFDQSAGLRFDNAKIKDFIKGSYGIEMYFRYNDGNLLIYNQILGSQVKSRRGQYVHLAFSRDAPSKKVNVFLDGKLKLNFTDSTDASAVDAGSIIDFFAIENTITSSGAVAMIKVYDYFIDEKRAEVLFKPFTTDTQPTTALQTNDVAVGQKIALNNLYFVQSKPELLPESTPELELILQFLRQNSNVEIELQGHTDNQGDYDLNLRLSKERAEAVKAYLIKNGVENKRVAGKGFGSTRPLASNTQEHTRKLNRRVELVITKK